MDEETNSSLVSVSVPLSVPLDLARGDVDLGVDVTNSGSSYWSLGPPTQQQQQPGLLVSVSELARLGGTRPPATDSRLVGVPTMGRVIPMSELNRLGIPEMRIVLQSDTKLEDDLDQLDMPVISETVMTVSESTGLMMRSHSQSLDDLQEMLPAVASLPSPGETVTTNLQLPKDRKVRDKTFPCAVLQRFVAEYKSGEMYDTVWECDGGRFKTHRLVLASASAVLRQVLLAESGEVTKSVVSTPDLSVQCVKSLLCLFYTGRVNINNETMSEINSAFKMLQFNGSNVTLLPTQNLIKQENEADDPGSFSQVQKKPRKCKNEINQESDEDWDPKTDLAFEEDIQGDDDVEEEEYWEPRGKKRKNSIVKNERWSDEEDTKWYSGFKRGRKSLKTPDTPEIYRTRGPGKGDRSYQLSLDLFDGRSVDFIHVCHGCYKVFDRYKEFCLHKDDAHPDNPNKRGDCHTNNSTQFKCRKCNQMIIVKHIAWFCKHLKFCRENNEIANSIVGPSDNESDTEDSIYYGKRIRGSKRTESVDSSAIPLKDTEERLRITGEAKGKNVQSLSNTLVGKVVDFIWGCKVCYSIFLTEDALETHKELEHKPDEFFGEHWNANSENYTCPHCKQVQNSRHLIWFIYHMKKCTTNSFLPLVKKETCETEDESEGEDDPQDIFDADQILLKTYNVSNERSEWVCQSLLGRIVPRLYPCHLCYQVFDDGELLKHHFRANHKGSANVVTNGPYFNEELSSFNCPVCQLNVCKNQSSAIKFIYHFNKCSGRAYRITKTCEECDLQFSQFKLYKTHLEQHRPTPRFMCHICTKHFPSNARLNYHVQYVHSTFKPFSCDKCEKSYKRKAELLEHEEMSHSSDFNYSCDKCGKQFYGKKNLALHMKTHYTEDEKKHVCNVCGHRFAKIKFLKNHMTVHSDVRQFACEVI